MKISLENMSKVTENICVLFGATNIGVLRAGKKIFLIDSGASEEDGKAILQAANELFPDAKISAIINTHSHADHCGGNAFLVRETGAEIWASAGEKPSIEYPRLENAIVWGGTPPLEIQHNFFEAEATSVSRILKDGETVFNEDTVSAYAVSLPGHYFDQIGIMVQDKEALKSVFFLGDAIFGRFRMGKYWIPYTFDIKQFKESLHKIEQISSDFYLPSHGDLIEEVSALVELNEFATVETEETIIKLLEKQPLTTEEVLARVAELNEIPLRIGQYALIGSTIRSYLSHLQEQKRIEFFFENNFLRWRLA